MYLKKEEMLYILLMVNTCAQMVVMKEKERERERLRKAVLYKYRINCQVAYKTMYNYP